MGIMGRPWSAALGEISMYLQRFGLARRPFPATPDTTLYYPATSHERALALLQEAVAGDEGLMLLTGPPGIGKTLLGQCLVERLGEEVVSALVINTHLHARHDLLQALLFDLGLPYEDGSEQVLRLRLTDLALTNAAQGKRTLFVIDEAQHLRPEILEEIRLLANLEGNQGRAVQALLLAQPNIETTLRRGDLAVLQQRLAVHPQIEPMSLEEAVDYLIHQVRGAGGRPEHLFEETALEMLARGAGGVPRLLNQVGHQAMLFADAAELEQIDSEAALEALAILGLGQAQEEEAMVGLKLAEDKRQAA